jgi:hypothetical protein
VGYALILGVKRVPIKRLRVVNILMGCMWEWDIKDISLDIKDVAEKMAKKWHWHQVELAAFMRCIGCV